MTDTLILFNELSAKKTLKKDLELIVKKMVQYLIQIEEILSDNTF